MASNVINLKIDNSDYSLRPYGECSTAAGTAAKTVTCANFVYFTGAVILVKFSNANTANTPTLNVNSQGAKNIFSKGAKITSGGNKALLAGTVEFMYDGTQWHLIGNYIDTDANTHYTSKNIVGASSTATANAAVSSNGVYLNHLEESAVKSTHKITGSGITTVTSDSSGNITISTSNPNTDTKNTAGSTNSSSKLFLIGATSQAANQQTYSNSKVYTSGGFLYSNGTKVSVEGHGHSYLPLSGGTMTGPIKYTLSNNRIFGIVPDPDKNNSVDVGFNWNNGDGAGCAFRSADRGGQEGEFIFFARKNTSDTCELVGKPNGQLTWCSNAVYHSGNLSTATTSAAGLMSATDKVKLDNVEPELFTTNSTGNFDYLSNKYTTRFTNASSTTKDPYGILGGNQCMVYSCILGNRDYGGQIAFGFDRPRIAFRRRSNGAWTNWEDIASQYVVRDRGSNTVSTLSSLPIDKSIVVATVRSATNLSLSSDMNVGDSLTILGTNSSSSNITQALPNSGNWKSMDGDSLKISAGKSFEINILCYASGKYSISCKTAV